ncbi:MAG: hypothetical protein JXJ20_14950 [Anaerolineae bacterium]|jgi:hypothetical protein|nr:hypothetical protein [Anaerolineae bacterium]
MDELIKMVMSQANLDESVAKQVIDIVLGQLKGKLPAPLGDNLEGILSGDVDAASLLKGDSKGILGMLTGLFKR